MNLLRISFLITHTANNITSEWKIHMITHAPIKFTGLLSLTTCSIRIIVDVTHNFELDEKILHSRRYPFA